MLLKVTEEVLFDRNTLYNSIIHRIHNYCYCSLFLLLFTVYTTVTVTITVTATSQYFDNMDTNCFN